MTMPKAPFYVKTQLGLSAAIVIAVSFVYGGNPSVILPYVFGFAVEDIDLKNIFRAIMGLYLAFGFFWVLGIRNATYLRAALISNVLFMGGLALGRIVSTFLDGISPQYTVGLVLELIMFFWGFYNLKAVEHSFK